MNSDQIINTIVSEFSCFRTELDCDHPSESRMLGQEPKFRDGTDVEKVIERVLGLSDEKERRVYYQGIVYSACNLLDRIFTPPLVCGTKDEPSTQLQMRLGALVDSFDPDGMHGDSDEIVTTEWLVEQGWDRGIHWPNAYTKARELLEWRGAGLWIGNTPIAQAVTRGKLRRVAVALGVGVTLPSKS